MQNDELFFTEYNRLNPEQKKAVDTVDGPVMVLAGPGTGKTQILSLRIANIVRTTDTPPDAILALTFTEAAAANMRTRLARMMGSNAYRVHIHTFHGFASHLIHSYPESFESIMASQLSTDVDQVRIIEKILKSFSGTYIRWYDTRNVFVYSLIGTIDQLKRERVSPEDLMKAAELELESVQSLPDLYHEKGAYKGKIKADYRDQIELCEKNKEIASLYQMYLDEQKSQKLYDFTDMLTAVEYAFQNDTDFLLRIQEEYQYILIDEHQDSNRLQNKIVELLAGFFESPNLFVVGDEKQAIYRFQGASPEYFFGFQKKYPDAVIVRLQQNYRSHQAVIDTAYQIMPDHEPLMSQPKEIVHPTLSVFPTEQHEYYGLTQWAKQYIQSGIDPNEIAILVRKNAQGTAMERAFRLAGIPARFESDSNIFDNPAVASIIQLLQVIYNPHNSESLARLLYADFMQLDPIDTARVIRGASNKRIKNLIDVMRSEQLLKEIGSEKPKPFLEKAKLIAGLHRDASTEHMVSVFDDIVVRFAIVSPGRDTLEADLDAIATLFSNVQGYASSHKGATLFQYIEYIQTLIDHDKPLSSHSARVHTGHVRIMTVHRSKGLEFDAVVIPSLTDQYWGGGRSGPITLLQSVLDSDPSSQDSDDERRLLFVALTRAKHHIRISYSEQNSTGGTTVPSKFLSEINGLVQYDITDIVAEYATDPIARIVPRESVSVDRKEQFHELIVGLLYARPFAVTHLNNYLADPWQYIFQNLIRVPQMQNSAMIYGTCAHAAMDATYKSTQYGTHTTDSFLSAFEKELSSQPISQGDYDRLMVKAKKDLLPWYESHKNIFTPHGKSEQRIAGVVIPDCNLVLSGVLDRIEYIDGSDSRVGVIDFKTGKPKSRNEILGKTATSDGNYYRQLQFYKLLLDNYRDGYHQMEYASLVFVEPKDKEATKYAEEVFNITSTDTADLVDSIRAMEQFMLAGEYWSHIPDPKKCSYCDLVLKITGE
jgi:DNA helicase-2/ATP-dependent DNA helicase PcrA